MKSWKGKEALGDHERGGWITSRLTWKREGWVGMTGITEKCGDIESRQQTLLVKTAEEKRREGRECFKNKILKLNRVTGSSISLITMIAHIQNTAHYRITLVNVFKTEAMFKFYFHTR